MTTEKVLVEDTFEYEGWIYDVEIERLSRRIPRGGNPDPKRRYGSITLNKKESMRHGKDPEDEYPVNLSKTWSYTVPLEQENSKFYQPSYQWEERKDPMDIHDHTRKLLELMIDEWEDLDRPKSLKDLVDRVRYEYDVIPNEDSS